MNKLRKVLIVNIILLFIFLNIVNAFESVTDTLNEGETKTYILYGKNYEVTVTAITDTGTIYAKFNINSEPTPSLIEGEEYILSDGATLTIIDIIPNEAGDVTQDIVQFNLSIPEEVLVRDFHDYGVDTNGDAFYDYLVIEFNLTVPETGEYEVEVDLEDSLGNTLYPINEYDEFDLNAGENTIQINFSGIRIYMNGVDGPYELAEIYIEGEDNDFVKVYFNLYNTSSYDYTDFQRPGATLTGIFSDYGYDKDGDGLYDYLVVEAEINVISAGNYRVWGQLEFYEGEIELEPHTDAYLEEGTHNIQLNFTGVGIFLGGVNGPYYPIEIRLDDLDDYVILDEYDYTSSAYNYTDFQGSGLEVTGNFTDYAVDIDDDGLYDYLTVRVPINVTVGGYYQIWADLELESDFDAEIYTEVYLDLDDEFIYLNFPGFSIYNNGENGSYVLDEFEIEYDYFEIYEMRDEYHTNSYNYTNFQRPPVKITGYYSDYGLDTNGNGLYDYLVAVIGLNVSKTGDYRMRLYLETDSYEYITKNKTMIYLPYGLYNASLLLDGSKIYKKGKNGPYMFTYVSVYDDNYNKIDRVYDAYITSDYSYTDFEDEITEDTIPPTITIINPINSSTINTNSTWLNVATDEDAICEYNICKFSSWSGGGGGGCSVAKNMSITGGTSHSQLIIGLENTINDETRTEKYSINVNCADDSGNSNTKSVTFYVNITEEDIPIANTFDGNTTDFSSLNESELANLSNVVLEKTTYGKIDFGSSTLDLSGGVDLDSYIAISNGVVAIDTDNLPTLNVPATITMYDLTYATTPVIYYNEGFTTNPSDFTIPCPIDICSSINYDPSTGVLTFDVTHFSSYGTGSNVTNNPPIANAGNDQTVSVNTTVTLDGSSSYDPDNDPITYSWAQTSGSAVNLYSTTAQKPTFTVTQAGTYSFQLTVNDGTADSSPDSVTIKVKGESKLAISDLDVKVGDKTDKDLNNGDKISRKAKPKDKVKFDIEVENIYPSSSDIEIEDIEVTITIEDIDDGDELEEDEEIDDLDAGDDDSITIEFTIPTLVEEGEYDVIIEIDGNEDGNEHEVRWELTLEVKKDEDALIIDDADLIPSLISCDRNPALEIEVVNIGREDEEDVSIEIRNDELGLNIEEKDIELEEGDDDDSVFDKTYRLKIDDNVKEGTYPITIKAYYDSKVGDEEAVDLTVEKCVEVITPLETEPVEVVIETPTITEPIAPVTEISFTDTSGFIAVLLFVFIILSGLVIFAFGYIIIKFRKN